MNKQVLAVKTKTQGLFISSKYVLAYLLFLYYTMFYLPVSRN